MGIQGRFPSSSKGITTLLFDLDGTLVRMNRSGLELRFMARAVVRFARVIPPWRYRKAFWEGAEALQRHGTDATNWTVFLETLGRHARCPPAELERIARVCVEKDFAHLGDRYGPIPGARETLLHASELGYRLVVATNPVFPRLAVEMRLSWGKLGDVPFDFITNSECMTRCKPDPAFYKELLEKLGVEGRQCVMIGNDARKDLPANELGCLTYLVEMPETRALIEQVKGDPRLDGWGSFEDLRRWLQEKT